MNTFKSGMVNAILTTVFCVSSSFASQISVTGASPDFTTLPFAATGSMSLTKSTTAVHCEALLVGTVSKTGDIQITNVTFKGNKICNAIKSGVSPLFPWIGKIDSQTQLTLNNVGVTTPTGEQCGPSVATATITDDGRETLISFNNAVITGGCMVNGTLTTHFVMSYRR